MGYSRELAEPIAIVGSACRFPGSASSPSRLWSLLSQPRDLGREIPIDRFGKGFYHPNGAHHGTTNVQHAYLLEEDIRVFDASFFNIHSKEADSIDPQQRLLLETVYEGKVNSLLGTEILLTFSKPWIVVVTRSKRSGALILPSILAL